MNLDEALEDYAGGDLPSEQQRQLGKLLRDDADTLAASWQTLVDYSVLATLTRPDRSQEIIANAIRIGLHTNASGRVKRAINRASRRPRRSRGMPRRSLVAVAILGLFTAATFALLPQHPQVSRETGELLPADDRLQAGVTYTTTSPVSLHWDNGTRVRVAGDSRFEIDQAGLTLNHGTVTTTVPHGNPFRTTTAELTAQVLGTRYIMTSQYQQSSVIVTDGAVQVQRRSDGASTLVTADQFTSSYPGPFAAHQAPSSEGLLAYWPLANDAQDHGPHQLHGQERGVAWLTGAHFADNGAEIRIGNPPALRRTEAMTVSAWIFPEASSMGRIIAKQGSTGQRGWSLNIESDNHLTFQLAVDRRTVINAASPPVDLQRWHHVCGVFQPGESYAIWVNGQHYPSDAPAPAAQFDSSLDVVIGRRPTRTNGFPGQIAEVRLYDRQLTAIEICALAALGPRPPQRLTTQH